MSIAEDLVKYYIKRGKDPRALADTLQDSVMRDELRAAIEKVTEEIGGPVS